MAAANVNAAHEGERDRAPEAPEGSSHIVWSGISIAAREQMLGACKDDAGVDEAVPGVGAAEKTRKAGKPTAASKWRARVGTARRKPSSSTMEPPDGGGKVVEMEPNAAG